MHPCHHVVDPVHVQDLTGPLVQPCTCELVLPTAKVGTDHLHLPQLVRHPNEKWVGKEAVWCRSLVVIQVLWWKVPELQVVLKL